jgi:membrane-associated phospholipid phosphatase
MKKELGFGLIAIATLFVIIFAEAFYREPLFNKSLNFIPSIQANASSAEIGFWQFWTDTGLSISEYGPTFVFFFWFPQRQRAIYYFCAFVTIQFITNVLKLGYHDPRPFWVSQEIIAYNCSGQYGNPSGHSAMSMGTAFVLWLDFCHTDHKPVFKIALLPVAIGFGLSIMYSRLIVGVHSIDQVIFGA